MKHLSSKHIFSLLALSLLVLPSCSAVGIATGVGAGVGMAAVQEGGLSRAASDARIQIEINDLWFRHNTEMFRKLDMTINQGRVLITGVVQDPEHRVEAVRLAWQPRGVKQVINEVRVADSEGFVGFAKDTWITGRLRTALTFDSEIQSVNYSIDTVQGTVYLMGFAQHREELNRVIEEARTLGGVKRVVSYVKFVGVQGDDSGVAEQGMNAQDAPQSQYHAPVYTDPVDSPTPLYEDANGVRGPQLQNYDGADDNAYPNNVRPVIIRADDQTVIGDSARVIPVEREEMRWND